MDWETLLAFSGLYILIIGSFYYLMLVSKRMIEFQKTIVNLQANLLEKYYGEEKVEE